MGLHVLVLATDYPNKNSRTQYFIHSRNLYYISKGIKVTVLNFSAKESYFFDNIRVISLLDFKKENAKMFSCLILHAPNIRNHYFFLLKYGSTFKKKIFVFHGHEILHINKYYPKQYSFKERKTVPTFVQNIYDSIKLFLWHNYFLRINGAVKLVFVSDWLYRQFLVEVKLPGEKLKPLVEIIPNSIGKFFEEKKYESLQRKYDFLTVRNNIDGESYSVDLVVKLAAEHPEYSFCLIGKGCFFDFNRKPDNLTWICREMTHEELGAYINQARRALILTRQDSHGVMACEMASFGIPLVTSDIPICREVFSDCPRVAFIDNDRLNLEQTIKRLDQNASDGIWERYYAKNTIFKEIDLIKKFVGKN